MQRVTGKQSLWRLAGNLALAGLVVSSMLLVSAAPSLAAGEAAPPIQEASAEGAKPRLERAYQRLLDTAEAQARHLERAGKAAQRAQEWIDKLAEEGKDVGELQAALADFEAALAEAQGYHQEAQAILETHTGFDDQGRVTDRAQALETVREGGRALRDAHRTLKDGLIDLRRTVRDWRREHRPQPASA
jgi:DNA repair exonuclease SbcCD ATPase subunit